MADKHTELWKRPETQRLTPERGPLFDDAQILLESLHSSKDLKKKKESEETRFITPLVQFRTDHRLPEHLAQAHLLKDSPNIYLAFDPDSSDPAMNRYSIDPTGMVTDIDAPSVNIDQTHPDFESIKVAIGQITRHLSELQYTRKRRADRRKLIAKRTLATAIVIPTVVGGVGFGIKKVIVDPRNEAERARNAYDNEKVLLEGDGVPINTEEFVPIQKDKFDRIPEYKDGDDLSSPRRVDLDGANGCVNIDTKVDYDKSLYVVVPEGSDLLEYTYQYSTQGTGLDICVVDHVVDGQIAIQIR